jgi:hypothetical protein
MAHSIGYLMEAVDVVINSFENNESIEMHEKKIYILNTVAAGFQTELEFQKYLAELINTKIPKKKFLLLQLIKLHIMKLEQENNKIKKTERNISHFKKSPMVPRNTRITTNSRPVSPIEDLIFEEVSLEELQELNI